MRVRDIRNQRRTHDMNTLKSLSVPFAGRVARSLICGIGIGLVPAASVVAQTTYTLIDLTPGASGVAQAVAPGRVAGLTGYAASAFTGRATLWTSGGAVDLHPGYLDGAGARSSVLGMGGGLQVGIGAGAATGNRNVPMAWRDSAESATILNIPFTNAGGQATATDGVQIVGSAIGLNRDGTTLDSGHAMIWDVATGGAVDLGADAVLSDVAGGQQVGMVIKSLANAALWRGTKSYTLLHPKNAVVSVASGTDGVRQVGYAGFDVRVRVEAVKGNKDKRFNYAHVWSGSAASGVNIHPYVSSFDGAFFEHSYAVKTAGGYTAGYVTNLAKLGTPAYYRAVVWNAAFEAVDLSAWLPAGFIGSQALAVDGAGNVAGVMTKADGTRHAVVWVPNF